MISIESTQASHHLSKFQLDIQILCMTTEFITLDLPQPTDPGQLIPLITKALEKYGTPLRWAITELPGPGQIRVEAVVTVIHPQSISQ